MTKLASNARHAVKYYGLTAVEAANVTSAQLSECAFWADAHGAARNSPLAQGYLLDLIRRDWAPFGSTPDSIHNQRGV